MSLTELELAVIPYATVVALERSLLSLPPWVEEENNPSAIHEYILDNSPDIARYRKTGGALFGDSGDDVRAAMERFWKCRSGGVKDLLGNLGEISRTLLDTSERGMPTFRLGKLSLGHLTLLNERIDFAALLCVWAAWGNEISLPGSKLQNEHFLLDTHQPAQSSGITLDELAETHLHVNAVLTTEIAWCLTVSDPALGLSPAPGTFRASNFLEGGPWEPRLLPHNKSLNPWLGWAALTRKLLAHFVKRNPKSGDDFVTQSEKYLRGRAFVPGVDVDKVISAWSDALMGDASGFDKLNGGSIVSALAQLRETPLYEEKEPPVEAAIKTERHWLVDALGLARALRQSQENIGQNYVPCDFDRAILQYLRVRNLFHRHLVYTGRYGGLRNFSLIFRRGSRYVKNLVSDENGLAFAFKHLDPSDKVKFVEFRHATAISNQGKEGPQTVDSVDKCLRSLWKFEEQAHQPKGGLIFHFLKRKPIIQGESEQWADYVKRLKKAMPLDGDAAFSEVDSWRNGRAFAFLLKQARSLHGAWSVGALNGWILGYDVAGVEEDCPTWPFLAVFHKLRDASKSFAVMRPGETGIGFTIHAGEMFSHVLAGLFRIGQAVNFLKGSRGRIGHALALSSDEPSRGKAWIKNEDWLMAVCWATELLGGPESAPPELRSALHSGIQELQEFGIHTTENNLIKAYAHLENYVHLAKIGFPFKEPSSHDSLQALMVSLLSAKSTYARWAEIPQERSDMPDGILASIREKLLADLKHNRITIEACPSSNLAIGLSRDAIVDEEGGYNRHPSLKLYGDSDLNQPLQVSLNTDDPLQFATDLATEYWRMYNAAKNQPLLNPDQWLAKRNDDARRSLFIPQEKKRSPVAVARDKWDQSKMDVSRREYAGENGLVTWYLEGSRV